jgi:hypothetical protein
MTATFRNALEHVIGAEGILSIRFGSGAVRLRAVDGTAVRVRDRGDHDIPDMFQVEVADGSLSLLVEHGRGWPGGRHHTPDLDVEVPLRASVVIETASGDISAEGLAGDQRYRTASGDMELRGCGGRVAVDAVSGDIEVVAAAEIDLSARTVSGDLEVRAGNVPRFRASTTSGDMKVAGRFAGEGPFTMETVSGDALLAPAGDVQIEMTTITGDLRSDLGGRPGGGRGHRTLSVGSGGPLITFRSLSGDLRVTRSVAMDRLEAPVVPVVIDSPTGSAGTTEDIVGSPVAAGAADSAAEPAEPPTSAEPDPAPTERTQTQEWTVPSAAATATPATPDTASEDTVDATHPMASLSEQDPRMEILRALERGDIDVAEAGARLEALDA